MESSDASLRRGTPYQRVPRFDRVWATIRLTLLEPGVVWANARPLWHSAWQLQNLTLLMASVGYGVGVAFAVADIGLPRGSADVGLHFALGMFFAAPSFIVLFLVAAVVGAVLRSSRGGQGFDKVLATTVVGHAAAGFVPGAVASSVSGIVMDLMRMRPGVCLWVQAACWLLGLGWFLMSVVGGAAEMRYANRDRRWVEEEDA